MTLTVEFLGDTHPKAALLTSDDKEAENARLQECLDQWGDDSPLAVKFRDTKPNEEGAVTLQVPPDELPDFAELIEEEFPATAEAINDMMTKARAEAEDALDDESGLAPA